MCDYMVFILMFMILVLVLIVCVMLLDCFLVIFYLYFYNKLIKNWRVILMIVGIWIFLVVMFSFYLMVGNKSLSFFLGFWCFLDFVYSDIKVFVFLYLVMGILVFGIIVVFNIIVIFNVCCNI